jgi:hypothetical protein
LGVSPKTIVKVRKYLVMWVNSRIKGKKRVRTLWNLP